MSHCPHCGVDLDPPKKGKPRSVPQNKRYFALIRSALHHWPHIHRFKPHSSDHLRKWLQARAGHAITTQIDLAGMSAEAAAAAIAGAIIAAAKADEHYYTAQDGPTFYVVRSKSINFDELPHLQACALFDAVAEVIEAETNLKVDQIMPPISEKRGKVEMRAEVPI